MESIGVLMISPVSPYLEKELDKRFKLFRFWNCPQRTQFLNDHAKSMHAIVGSSVTGVDAELIEAFTKLEIVSNFGCGVDKIDLNKCKAKGVWVTIGLILALLRRRSGKWKQSDYKLTTKFSSKTVGIVGLGKNGMAIASRAKTFNCSICYYSRTEKPESKYKYYSSVVELASNCHILVVACSLTKETHRIISREVNDALGPKGVLINIERGKSVDEPELVYALLEGRLGGAGLDVFQNEPNVPEQLHGLENVVLLLPHIGSSSVETHCNS